MGNILENLGRLRDTSAETSAIMQAIEAQKGAINQAVNAVDKAQARADAKQQAQDAKDIELAKLEQENKTMSTLAAKEQAAKQEAAFVAKNPKASPEQVQQYLQENNLTESQLLDKVNAQSQKNLEAQGYGKQYHSPFVSMITGLTGLVGKGVSAIKERATQSTGVGANAGAGVGEPTTSTPAQSTPAQKTITGKSVSSSKIGAR